MADSIMIGMDRYEIVWIASTDGSNYTGLRSWRDLLRVPIIPLNIQRDSVDCTWQISRSACFRWNSLDDIDIFYEIFSTEDRTEAVRCRVEIATLRILL